MTNFNAFLKQNYNNPFFEIDEYFKVIINNLIFKLDVEENKFLKQFENMSVFYFSGSPNQKKSFI